MIKEVFLDFIHNWQKDKIIALQSINDNKIFNSNLKADGIDGKEYNNQKKNILSL